MELLKRSWRRTPQSIRKTLVLIVGLLIIAAGAIMLAVPGPGWLTIFIGLAVLSTEFEFARRLKERAEHKFKQLAQAAKERATQGKGKKRT